MNIQIKLLNDTVIEVRTLEGFKIGHIAPNGDFYNTTPSASAIRMEELADIYNVGLNYPHFKEYLRTTKNNKG